MTPSLLTALLLSVTAIGFYLARQRAFTVAGDNIRVLHSLPRYYGAYAALWCAIPALLIIIAWMALEPVLITRMVVASLPEEVRSLPSGQLDLVVNDIRNQLTGNAMATRYSAVTGPAAGYYSHLQQISAAARGVIVLVLATLGFGWAWRRISPSFPARNQVERAIRIVLIATSSIAILTTLGIVLSVLFESIRFFGSVSPAEFLFGLQWSPQTAIRSDQIGASGLFGAVPLFAGTLLISAVAMAVAVPVGLLSAVYLSEYATRRFRAVAKPLLEILAGIPTVVYGFFAALFVAPFIRDIGVAAGLDVSSESALAAGLVMGIMIIPFVSSLSDDVINAVPQSLRDGSLALGATESETIRQVVLPAALPGIVGGVLLAVSRAIGETMIVVMAAGLAANLTANPLDSVTTVTVQIVTLLVGDQEFDSPKTLAAFALGLVLFTITLALNVLALYIVRKYREQYE